MSGVKGERRVPLVSKGKLQGLAFAPIAGFVGWNGSGKSLAAAAAAMVHLDLGRPVLSTMRLQDWRDPRPCEDPTCESPLHGDPSHLAAHPLWVPFVDFRQLFDFQDGHVLMDEVTGVADAREHKSMPVQVANYLPQLRRRDVTLHWTTIGWGFADIRIRRITLAVCHAAGYMGKTAPETLWKSNRLFLWRVYTGEDFDALESHKLERMRVLSRHVMWRPNSDVTRAYNTWEPVLQLGAVNDAGMCITCGGRRSVPKCSCPTLDPLALPVVSVPVKVNGPQATGATRSTVSDWDSGGSVNDN